MTIRDQHLLFLAARFQVQVDYKPALDINAFPTEHRIDVHPCSTDRLYAIALHELGHCVLNHRPEQSRAWKEVLAWAWAQRHAMYWSDEMQAERCHCLNLWNINHSPVDIPSVIRHWDCHAFVGATALNWDHS